MQGKRVAINKDNGFLEGEIDYIIKRVVSIFVKYTIIIFRRN